MRKHTRRTARSNPQGVLKVTGGRFGFVATAEGEFFIPEKKMAGAFDGDLVEICPLPSTAYAYDKRALGQVKGAQGQAKPAARVVRVIDRAHDVLIGRYEIAEPFGVVVPEDPRIPYDIFTMLRDNPQVPDGALVRVRILNFPSRRDAATGVVEEVLGTADDPNLGVEAIVARHRLETEFSAAAQEAAEAAQLDELGALQQGYADLRERVVFTIDPADARDFDDALSLSALEAPAELWNQLEDAGAQDGAEDAPSSNRLRSLLKHAFSAADAASESLLQAAGAHKEQPANPRILYRLGVHIADVSHYVGWGTSLDLAARHRATSVYLVDRVLPMLPEVLSNGLCSLAPGQPRRAMTCDIYLDAQAKVLAYDLYPSLIESKQRFTYDEVQQILQHVQASGVPLDAEKSNSAGNQTQDDESFAAQLCALSQLAQKRQALRLAQGGIEFEVPEAKVRLDKHNKPLSIDLRVKNAATSLVEEGMILANELVASYLVNHAYPGLYRVHEKPSPDNLAALLPVLQEFPWYKQVSAERLVAGNPHEIQHVLALSEGRPEQVLVVQLMLRAQKRACYSPFCDGHFGLGLSTYCHFTSPIRRYPDLVIHRMLHCCLRHKRSEDFDQQVASLNLLAEHSSAMERVAEQAARESQQLKMVEYLEPYVGERFSAVVSGVTNYGLYVQLDNMAEGLLDVSALGNEYFSFDATRYTLTGEESLREYRLGQRLAVVLQTADTRAATLSFKLA